MILQKSKIVKRSGMLDTCIVLRKIGKEFVTHHFTMLNKSYFWGHYFQENELKRAVNDYEKRVQDFEKYF